MPEPLALVDDGRRLIVLGRLVAETPLHIGSGRVTSRTDAPVTRDATGRIVVPASALAGALRSHLAALDLPGVDALFGGPEERDGSAGSRESPLWVDHASVMGDPQLPVWVRQRVGIDRARRAAARGILFDLEIVPKGVAFEMRLEYRHLRKKNDDVLALGTLAWMLAEARTLGIRLGGRSATGLGHLTMELAELVDIDLTSGDQLDAWLRDREPGERREDHPAFPRLDPDATLRSLAAGTEPGPAAARKDVLRLELRVETEEPLLVRGTEFLRPMTNEPAWMEPPDPAGSDSTPALAPVPTAVGWTWVPSLPGSSLRGALRSRAEMIMRTVTDREPLLAACDPFERGDPERSCALRAIAAERTLDREGRDALSAGLRGAACPVCSLFGHARLASRVRIADAAAAVSPHLRDHVAIDRVTGATAGALKFDDAPVPAGTVFRPVIEVVDPEPATLGLLLLALRDLEEGDLVLGASGARGYGQVSVTCEEAVVLSLSASPLDRHLDVPSGEPTGPTRIVRRLDGWDELRSWTEPALRDLQTLQAREPLEGVRS
jgi:CRISPR/Cas system CSM-associated protein Csm3 (group 7 of RAMP superfamily)